MDSTNAETIQDLAFAQGADVQDVLDGHGIVVPPGYTHLDLEEAADELDVPVYYADQS